MADGVRPFEPDQFLFMKRIMDHPHPAMGQKFPAIARANAARLLPPMLKRVETQISQLARFGIVVDADYSAHIPTIAITGVGLIFFSFLSFYKLTVSLTTRKFCFP